MGLLQERDCHQLGNAGHLARQRGILQKGQSLTCSYTGCEQVNCKLVENPLVRTIYVSSVQAPPVTQMDKFYQKLQAHKDMVGISR